MRGRFGKPVVTKQGRIGHPVAIDRRLVRCAGITFEDFDLRKKWTFRMYEAYGDRWPAMDIWTVQRQEGVRRNTRGASLPAVYGNQTPITEEAVPDEVKAYAMAQLVQLRLRGEVRG